MIGRPVLVLALLGLAAPLSAAAEPVGPTLPWNTLDCHFVYASATIPVARIADRIPAGFRPFTTNPVTAGQLTDIVLEADDCAEGSGANGQVAPMEYASIWIPTIVPPRYNVGIFTVLAWDVLVPDDERRDLLADAGAPVRDGSVTFGADLSQGMPLGPFAVEWTLEGVGAYRLDIVPTREVAPAGGEFAQYTPGEDGSMTYWRTFWQTERSYQGVGVATLPEGSWQAEAFGTTHVPVRVNFGTWDYFDGKIVTG